MDNGNIQVGIASLCVKEDSSGTNFRTIESTPDDSAEGTESAMDMTIIQLHPENPCHQSEDTQVGSGDPEPGLPSHSFIKKGLFSGKEEKKENSTPFSRIIVPSSASWKRGRWRNSKMHQKPWYSSRQKKPAKNPKIQWKSWTHPHKRRKSVNDSKIRFFI